jgi:hypothetical protein
MQKLNATDKAKCKLQLEQLAWRRSIATLRGSAAVLGLLFVNLAISPGNSFLLLLLWYLTLEKSGITAVFLMDSYTCCPLRKLHMYHLVMPSTGLTNLMVLPQRLAI